MNRPTATYRIQFNPAFGFRDAEEIVPYLSELGITDLYTSPIFKAKKGSLHGYDVVDPNAINSELGTRADLDRLSEALHGRQMGWIQDNVIKAVREAKVHTVWLHPDREYEDACLSFVESILVPEESNSFLKELKPFQIKVAHYGVFNSLSQTLLKITAPGVPDFYQGTELWDLNLVDPDNRRPVDFGLRFRHLREIHRRIETDVLELIRELLVMKEDGRVKLFLLVQALNARKARADIFQKGAYKPLAVARQFRKYLIAFARRDASAWSLTVAPRFLTAVVEGGGLPLRSGSLAGQGGDTASAGSFALAQRVDRQGSFERTNSVGW